MENKRLENKIKDWAIGLGFRLPDGSAPPLSYFALLTATPHRRQLWATLVESIQPRKKVEYMKKQILVSELKEMPKKNTQTTNKRELWEKQTTLETEIEKRKVFINKLERDIMTKASDLLFEICKLAEHEKQCELYKEKVLVLKLYTKRKKESLVKLQEKLLKVGRISSEGYGLLEKGFSSVEEFRNLVENCPRSGVNNKMDEILNCGISEKCFWAEIINCKEIILDKFCCFMENFGSKKKNALSVTEQLIEKGLTSAITHLKKRITEKSLEVIINEMEGKLLKGEVERLQEKVESFIVKRCPDGNFSETFFFSPEETNDVCAENDRSLMKLRNYVNSVGHSSFEGILRSEIKKLKEDHGTKSLAKEQFYKSSGSFESVLEEVNHYKFEQEEFKGKISGQYETLETLINSIRNEVQEEGYRRILEETVVKIKTQSEKQMNIFLETPLEVFKMVNISLERKVFVSQSLCHFMNSYGGEFKHFFSATLIPPEGEVERIFRELEKRSKCTDTLMKFVAERGKQLETQKMLHSRLVVIKSDSQQCTENFKEAEEILWEVLFQAEEMNQSIEFIEEILKNWLEQPYRHKIKQTETVNGKTLKEHEEIFGKNRVV